MGHLGSWAWRQGSRDLGVRDTLNFGPGNSNIRTQFQLPGLPKACKIMALMAVTVGLGRLFCVLLGFRYGFGSFPK